MKYKLNEMTKRKKKLLYNKIFLPIISKCIFHRFY